MKHLEEESLVDGDVTNNIDISDSNGTRVIGEGEM